MTKRIGNQNPTQNLVLPFKKSLFKDAIAIYEKSGRKAQKWQANLLEQILALNKDNLWTHTKYGYSLPRRNGKNEVVAIVEMYGLDQGWKILHTAHRTTTSHSAWERLCKLLDDAEIEYSSLKAKGSERIELSSGGRVEFRTRTTTGGLGEGFDLLIIDEAQEYTDDQESTLKYVVSDSKNPQTILCGTPPTPLSSGTIFTALRNKALSGGMVNTGWAEWSVEEETDPYDIDAWYLTNPSLGTILTERAVTDEIGTDDIDFNIQRLGLWLRYNQKSAISKTEWVELQVTSLPAFRSPLFVGIKYGHDGTNVAMSIALKTASGKIFVEVIDCRSIRDGNDWIVAFLKAADIKTIVVDGANGQGLLSQEMKDVRLKEPILPTVKEIIVANAAFERGIYQKTIRHMEQLSLTEVVSNCDKRNIGSSGGFGYRSQLEDYDISLMDSVILAHWACIEDKPTRKQTISY